MTIKDFYESALGDYTEAINCLGKEERIYKYLKKFPAMQNAALIKEALQREDYDTAFREAHNLKGMSMNMALTKLHEVSSNLTESLRNGPKGDVWGLFESAEAEYVRVCTLIERVEM